MEIYVLGLVRKPCIVAFPQYKDHIVMCRIDGLISNSARQLIGTFFCRMIFTQYFAYIMLSSEPNLIKPFSMDYNLLYLQN